MKEFVNIFLFFILFKKFPIVYKTLQNLGGGGMYWNKFLQNLGGRPPPAPPPPAADPMYATNLFWMRLSLLMAGDGRDYETAAFNTRRPIARALTYEYKAPCQIIVTKNYSNWIASN